MLPRWRFIAGGLGILITIHLLLSLHPTYRANTTPGGFGLLPSGGSSDDKPTLGSWLGSKNPPGSALPELPDAAILHAALEAEHEKLATRRKAKAAFVVLARNSDLWELLHSMRQMEDRFNYWADYDWVFLNDDVFSDEFKEQTQAQTRSKCKYGLIPRDHWVQPDWIDEEKATAARQDLINKKVIYGHSVPYRNMCRFNSGFFWRHPLLDDYDYYWRVEPSVKYFCDLNYDPFLLLQDEGKLYGFTLSLYEYIETIPTLWNATKEFIELHPEYVSKDNAMAFLSDDGGEKYNLCHFWSNFEIGDLRLWRSDAYRAYFDFLDKKGGFYYERWGDAPVHSIAAALFARKDQIHWFDDIGYRHEPFQHCPTGEAHKKNRCWCNPQDTFDWEWYSCTKRYVDMFKK